MTDKVSEEKTIAVTRIRKDKTNNREERSIVERMPLE